MPFSHNGLKTASGIQVFSQVNKYSLSYRSLDGNVQGCVFAKNSPVSLNLTDYIINLKIVSEYDQEIPQSQTAENPMASRGRAAQPSRDTRKTN